MTQTGQSSPLRTDRGTTTINSAVVRSIAGMVVREVLGNLSSTGNRTRGVSVEVGDTQAAVDLTVTVPYGRSIPEISQEMRDAAIRRIENLTGLEVTEVNITVRDVFIPQQQ